MKQLVFRCLALLPTDLPTCNYVRLGSSFCTFSTLDNLIQVLPKQVFPKQPVIENKMQRVFISRTAL